jgi:hypothetical protein
MAEDFACEVRAQGLDKAGVKIVPLMEMTLD